MSDTSSRRSPAATALLIALVVSALVALSGWLLGKEVDDPVGGSLTIMFGLVGAVVAGTFLFLFAWIALRHRDSRTVSALYWTLAGVVAAGALWFAISLEGSRRDYVAARDPEASPERLRALDPRDSIVLHRLASNPATPPDLLADLALRYEFVVRDRLLENPSTPDDVRAELTSRER